jgi:hypothetical protein
MSHRTRMQVKLSDLATCSPSSTVRLESVIQGIDDREVSELPSRSGSSGKVEAEGGSNDFTQIRRVSINCTLFNT